MLKEEGIKFLNYLDMAVNWEKEKLYLRINLRNWFNKNIKHLLTLYPNLCLSEFRILDLLNLIYEAYMENKHTHLISSAFMIKDKINNLMQQDALLLKALALK